MSELVSVPVNNDVTYGAWSDEDLRAAVAGGYGVGGGDSAGLPPIIRFAQRVADTLRICETSESVLDDPIKPSYFLLYPQDVDGANRVRMLKTGQHPTAGRIWFVNEAATSGQWVDTEGLTDDDAIEYIINGLGFGSVPGIMYDPRSNPTRIHLFEEGFAGDYRTVDLDPEPLTLDEIYAAIDTIYEENLITPDAREGVAPLWEDNRKGWPVRNAEKTVQHYLRVGLSTAILPRRVRAEGTTPGGRFDLLIVELDPFVPGQLTHHALLELKVLKSWGSTGDSVSDSKTLNWIDEGVNQAYNYRQRKNATASALCCFDMRTKDTGEICFDHVRDKAEKLKVGLKRWYLYTTSKQLRAAEAARTIVDE